jgi:hypothetical protein
MDIILILKQFLATLVVWTITFLIIKKQEHEKLRKTTYMVFYFLGLIFMFSIVVFTYSIYLITQ